MALTPSTTSAQSVNAIRHPHAPNETKSVARMRVVRWSRGLADRSPRLPDSFGRHRSPIGMPTARRVPLSPITQRRTPWLSRTLPETTTIGPPPSAVGPPAGPITEEEAPAVRPPTESICPSTEAISPSAGLSLCARQRERSRSQIGSHGSQTKYGQRPSAGEAFVWCGHKSSNSISFREER
jgi:hypothetical protein